MRIITRLILLFTFVVAGITIPWGQGQGVEKLLVMSVIDVGQADSILVEFPNGQTMLVDAADQAHGPTVVSYLRSRGVNRVDILVATHPHEDHVGGIMDVMTAFPVGKVWDSGYNIGSRTQQQYLQAIKDKGIQYGQPRAGFTQSVGQAGIAVLAPRQLISGTSSDANNNSIVMRVALGQQSYLLTGDMEEAERATVTNWPRSTVLKVAHHGSRNGTDPAFLGQVSPQIAVLSYAEANEYGHPHPETRQALQNAGVRPYSTAMNGTVIVRTDGTNRTVTTFGKGNAVAMAASTNSSSSSRCNYIGNRRTHIYHRPTASHLPKPENRVCFSSRAAAERAGYRACRLCF